MKKEPRKSSRLQGVSISKADFDAVVALGNKQPTINMHGGVGIPGGRTLTDVANFKPLNFKKLKSETGAMLKTSKNFARWAKRQIHRRQANGSRRVNRKMVYSKDQIRMHSLHVGNDSSASVITIESLKCYSRGRANVFGAFSALANNANYSRHFYTST